MKYLRRVPKKLNYFEVSYTLQKHGTNQINDFKIEQIWKNI